MKKEYETLNKALELGYIPDYTEFRTDLFPIITDIETFKEALEQVFTMGYDTKIPLSIDDTVNTYLCKVYFYNNYRDLKTIIHSCSFNLTNVINYINTHDLYKKCIKAMEFNVSDTGDNGEEYKI